MMFGLSLVILLMCAQPSWFVGGKLRSRTSSPGLARTCEPNELGFHVTRLLPMAREHLLSRGKDREAAMHAGLMELKARMSDVLALFGKQDVASAVYGPEDTILVSLHTLVQKSFVPEVAMAGAQYGLLKLTDGLEPRIHASH